MHGNSGGNQQFSSASFDTPKFATASTLFQKPFQYFMWNCAPLRLPHSHFTPEIICVTGLTV